MVNPSQRFQAISGAGDFMGAPADLGEELNAKQRDTWVPALANKIQRMMLQKDPNFDSWKGLEGYEEFASDLVDNQSQAERDMTLRWIDKRRLDRATAANGKAGLYADLMIGAADPINVIPIPVVRGIGILRGALAFGAANTALATATEGGRHWADPTVTRSDSLYNIGIAGLIGGALGGVGNIWGGTERATALRDLDGALGDLDGPLVSVEVRGFDENMQIRDGRPPPNPDGSTPRIVVRDEFAGYEPKELAGERYVYRDGYGWVHGRDATAPQAAAVSDDIADQLGAPASRTERIMHRDDQALGKDYVEAQWQDEIAGYIDDAKPVEQVVTSYKDFVNFRTRQHLWERTLKPKDGEAPQAFRERAGKQAMKEYRASKAPGSYAGQKAIAKILEQLNFSPMARAIKLADGDTMVSDTALRLGGDYGYAIKANEYGFASPPSVFLHGLRHEANFQRFHAEFEQAWVRMVSGNAEAKGLNVLNANITAAAYRFKRGQRWLTGKDQMDYRTFGEMVTRAVFDPSEFVYKGFPVNDEIRKAAKQLGLLLQQYDDMAREAGVFKDQRQLTRDVGYWGRETVRLKDRVNEWLWGLGNDKPTAFVRAIRVKVPAAQGPTPFEAEMTWRPAVQLPDGRILSQDFKREWGLPGNPWERHGDITNYLAQFMPEIDPTFLELDNAMGYADPKTGAFIGFEDLHAPKEREVIYTGDTHDEAIRFMLDDLGDRGVPLSENLQAGDYGYTSDLEPGFVSVDDMEKRRAATLTDKQREVYQQRREALDQAEAAMAKTEEHLAIVTEQPHQFVNAAGKPEMYFPRHWQGALLQEKREQAIYMIAKWYERDNPDGALQRAEETVDKIILGDIGSAATTNSVSYLNQRALNIPNSWKVSHPEWGEIAVADFINTNALAVAQHYVRSTGTRIEAARMFGDPSLTQHKIKLREHLIDKYWMPAKSDSGRKAAMEKILQIEGELDLTARSVFGTLKTKDPWAWDNQTATALKDFGHLTMMGKSALNSMIDVMHTGMAQGFGTMFRSVFMRMIDDIDTTDLTKIHKEINELFEFTSHQHNARAEAVAAGRPELGAWPITNWLHDRVPGFFKLTGLPQSTVWLKDMVMTAAQHNVMKDSLRIARKIEAGTELSKKDTLRLASLGIGPRDAVLIASMPFEKWKGGKLLLPSAHKWEGPEGKLARDKLLNAIHAESRRAVVTPSIGDRATIFNGVWTKKGKVAGETDLLTVPMQFLGYSVAAHNKVLASALQGRDREAVLGMFSMVAMAFMVGYLKTDRMTWRARTWDQHMYEAVKSAGIGGFWFNDLPDMIGRYTNDRVGIRASLGIRSDAARNPKEVHELVISALGAGPSKFYETSRAFWDPDATPSERAALIRKGIVYNNVIWWDAFFRDMTGEVASTFEGGRK